MHSARVDAQVTVISTLLSFLTVQFGAAFPTRHDGSAVLKKNFEPSTSRRPPIAATTATLRSELPGNFEARQMLVSEVNISIFGVPGTILR